MHSDFRLGPAPFKAVGTDLDGTLLSSSKQLSAQFETILEKLKNRGVLLFPITGKTLGLTKKIFAGLDLPMVCLDGAVIKVRGKALWDQKSFLPEKVVRESLILTRRIPLFLIDRDVLYIRRPLAKVHYENWACRYGLDPEKADLSSVTHLVIPHSDYEFLQRLRSRIRARFGGNLRYFISSERFKEKHFFILRSPFLSKYLGSRRLLQEYGLALKDMLFFGDWKNDIPLLKRVGFPIVMREASDEVARFARAVTLFSNEAEGVERCLKVYFKLD